MSGFRRIFTSVVPEFTEVRLYDETLHHIKESHPEIPIELPSIIIAIESAITNPTHIEISYLNSWIFVDSNSTNQSGDPLRIPVKNISGTSGRVKTAYFATSSSATIIWGKG